MIKWTGQRDGKEHILYTAKSNQKILVSALVEQIILKHDCESASKEIVAKYHAQAKAYIFKTLKDNFSEEPVQDMYGLLAAN